MVAIPEVCSLSQSVIGRLYWLVGDFKIKLSTPEKTAYRSTNSIERLVRRFVNLSTQT